MTKTYYSYHGKNLIPLTMAKIVTP